MIKIAIYGKGGIGKSTTTANTSAALACSGYKVMQIGCDPKADSTRSLTSGVAVPTVLDTLQKNPGAGLTDLVHQGYKGIFCVETGGPVPGLGCAGRGIITAMERLEECRAFEELAPDVVLYDVLGDVVCGGFAMPIRNGYAQKVFVVTSGEAMSLFAAENIHSAVNRFQSMGYSGFGGFILNRRGVPREKAHVSKKAAQLDTRIIHDIPRDPVVQSCEHQNQTVVECCPGHELAENYRALAQKLVKG